MVFLRLMGVVRVVDRSLISREPSRRFSNDGIASLRASLTNQGSSEETHIATAGGF